MTHDPQDGRSCSGTDELTFLHLFCKNSNNGLPHRSRRPCGRMRPRLRSAERGPSPNALSWRVHNHRRKPALNEFPERVSMTSVKSASPLVVFLAALLCSSLFHQAGGNFVENQLRLSENSERLGPRTSICRGWNASSPQPSSKSARKPENDEEKQLQVKVITFNQGRFDPPILEPFRFWPRGHTAVIIDGTVHSFEADWQCGTTEAAYKEDNEWRGAWVQVLDVPESDAGQIQKDFERSCGAGAFLLTGVCTSSAGKLLQNVLTDLKVTWAPMQLRRQLAERSHVARTYRWHPEVWANNFLRCVEKRKRDRYRSTDPRPPRMNVQDVRDGCLRRLGLSKKDIAPLVESPKDTQPCLLRSALCPEQASPAPSC